MKVDVRKIGDVVVVDLEGRLVAGVGDELLREVINELLAEGWRKILLNMAQVRYIDSAGIGELVASLHTAQTFGATLRSTRRMEGKVERVLHLSQVLPLLSVHESEEEALAAFAEQGPVDEAPPSGDGAGEALPANSA